MLDFFDKLENKRAFKRALKELEKENKKTNQTQNISRVYTSSQSSTVNYGEAQIEPAFKTKRTLGKPSSEVVDLKNFKDWRKNDKVESKNQVYNGRLYKDFAKKSYFDDDEFTLGDPVVTTKEETLRQHDTYKNQSDQETKLVDLLSNSNEEEKEPAVDFASYFLNRNASKQTEVEKLQENSQKSDNIKQDTSHVNKDSESKTQREEKTSQKNADMVEDARAKFNKMLSELKNNKPEEEKQKPEIKVEIEKPKTVKQPQKEAKKRKPRGKNKRRFDADVVTSIDWR